MTVFIVERCYAYEGCTVLGVFATVEAAKGFCEAREERALGWWSTPLADGRQLWKTEEIVGLVLCEWEVEG